MSEAILPDHKPTRYTAEVVPTSLRRVVCDGPAVGKHPRVFLTMVDDAQGHPQHVVCPYCSRTFVYQGGKADNSH